MTATAKVPYLRSGCLQTYVQARPKGREGTQRALGFNAAEALGQADTAATSKSAEGSEADLREMLGARDELMNRWRPCPSLAPGQHMPSHLVKICSLRGILEPRDGLRLCSGLASGIQLDRPHQEGAQHVIAKDMNDCTSPLAWFMSTLARTVS